MSWAVVTTSSINSFSGLSKPPMLAVASTGCRSLNPGEISRVESVNCTVAISSANAFTIPIPYSGWRTFMPILRSLIFMIRS
ncbi:MAG: hypothetical protein CMO80_23065 [Verrucomicrobiales bacterium]|nr:hypothetical protein [Verrucomicrobiales bacterium]